MEIRAVFFDVDNTLYSYDAAHALAFRALSEYAARHFGLTEEAFGTLHRDMMREQERRAGSACAAIHNRLLRYQLLLEAIGQPVARAPEMVRVYWPTFLRVMRPAPGLRRCFAYLKGKGYKIGIGTNMTADYQYEKLARLGVLEEIDALVTSEEVGVEKPDRKLFDFCAKKAGCLPEECLFVGDNPVHDVRGAWEAGMRPVWMRPVGGTETPPGMDPLPGEEALPAALREVPRIPSLLDLPTLLETL